MATPKKQTGTSAQAAFKPIATGMEDVLEKSRQAAASRTRTEPAKAVAEITGNPFHKIMFDPALSLDEKRKAMSSAMVFDKSMTEDQNAERLNSFVEFSEWLQSKRKDLAIDMLKLNDAEAFAQLKEVIEELGQGILDFNKKIEPFLAILDSMYQMQLRGIKTSDMLEEILKDKEEIERLNTELEEYGEGMEKSEGRISYYKDRVAELKTQTSWWTLGSKIKPAAQAEINKIDLRITEETAKIGDLAEKIKVTQNPWKPRVSRASKVWKTSRTISGL